MLRKPICVMCENKIFRSYPSRIISNGAISNPFSSEPVDSPAEATGNESDNFDQIQEPDLINNFALKTESFDDADQENKATFIGHIIKEEIKEEYNLSSDNSSFYNANGLKNENVDDESCQIETKNVTVKAERDRDVESSEELQNVPLTEETVELFKCDSCAYETKRRSDLNRHVIIKHSEGAELFKCKRCPYKAKLKVYLNKHVDRTHRKHTELFKCDSCEYETKTTCNMKAHIYRNHRQDTAVFRCDSCPYETKSKRNLKIHFNFVHRERTKLFRCDICPFETVFRSNLKGHFDRKHRDHSEIFKCTSCLYKTKIKSDYDKHINRKHSI